MKLLLVRHGEYQHPARNPNCPLSAQGRENIALLAKFLIRQRVKVSQVYHSGIHRADETAEILEGAVCPDGKRQLLKGLHPNDEIEAIISFVNQSDEDLMLVGHLPFLELLTGYLLTGDELERVVSFSQGTACYLERTNEKWDLLWSSNPPERRI